MLSRTLRRRALWGLRAAATGPQRCDARGTVGYNYQFDRFVLGVEGDYSWGDITDSKRDGNDIIENSKIDGFGTIRGRIGYVVGNFLPYVTGGVSFERMQLGQSCPDQVRRRLAGAIRMGLTISTIANGTLATSWAAASSGKLASASH